MKALKELDAEAVPTVGEDLAESVIGTIEADLTLAVHRRAMAAAQARLRRINSDVRQMVTDLNANYSETEATLVRLGIQGMRDELFQCYLTVNPAMARSAEGRKQVADLTQQVLDGLLKQITPPQTDGVTIRRPTRARSAGS